MLFEKTSSSLLCFSSPVSEIKVLFISLSLTQMLSIGREKNKVIKCWGYDTKALQEGGDIVAKENLLWLGKMATALILAYSLIASCKTGRIKQPGIECGVKAVLLFHKHTDGVFTPCFLYHWVPSAWKVFNNWMTGWVKIFFTGLQVQCPVCLDINQVHAWLMTCCYISTHPVYRIQSLLLTTLALHCS